MDGFPIRSGLFVPAKDRGAVFLSEYEVLPEADIAEGKASVQSSDVDSKLLPDQHRMYLDPLQPTPDLGVGSPVELLQDSSRRGVVRWLGSLPETRGLVAGVELVRYGV